MKTLTDAEMAKVTGGRRQPPSGIPTVHAKQPLQWDDDDLNIGVGFDESDLDLIDDGGDMWDLEDGEEEECQTNPERSTIEERLAELAKTSGVPLATLTALIGAESDFRQFDANGQPLYSDKSSAVGLGQIVEDTANRWGLDYDRLGTDWEYNLDSAVMIFAGDEFWGYDSTRVQILSLEKNPGASVDDESYLRFRAMAAYYQYHTDPDNERDLSDYDELRDAIEESGSLNWMERFLDYYDNPGARETPPRDGCSN